MSSFSELIDSYKSEKINNIPVADLIVKGPKSPSGVGRISEMSEGEIIAFTSGAKLFYVNEYLVDGEYIFMNDGGSADTKFFNGKAYYSDHVFCFTTNKKVKARYLFHYLLSINDYINSNIFRGSGIKNLVKKEFMELEVPVPSVEIQKRIIEILDLFLELKESLKSNQELRISQLNYYRNKLLTFDDKTKRIELGKLCSIKGRVGWQRLTKSEYQLSGDYYLVTGTDFLKNNKVDFDHCYYVSKDRYDQDPYIQLKVGDVLLTKDGTIGKVAFIDSLPKPATLNSHLVVFRDLSGRVYPKFLMHMLLSQHFIDFAESKSSKGTIAGLPQNVIASFPMPIPPIEEQKRISEILDYFSLIALDYDKGIPAEMLLREKQFKYYRDLIFSFKEGNNE